MPQLIETSRLSKKFKAKAVAIHHIFSCINDQEVCPRFLEEVLADHQCNSIENGFDGYECSGPHTRSQRNTLNLVSIWGHH